MDAGLQRQNTLLCRAAHTIKDKHLVKSALSFALIKRIVQLINVARYFSMVQIKEHIITLWHF
jgi:hypothetical protein